MSGVDDALRRWWETEAPKVRAELRKRYRVSALSEDTIRLLMASTGEAFRAGWRARERLQQAQGTQRNLLGGED